MTNIFEYSNIRIYSPHSVMYWSLANLNYTALHSKLYYSNTHKDWPATLACYIRNCITPHKDWPASSQNHFNPEWMSLLTDLILRGVTMISPSHTLNIRWSSHLRWPDHLQSHSVGDFISVQFLENMYIDF